MTKPFTTVAVVVFALMALAHLLRLILGFDVVLNGSALPQWPSAIGLMIAATLAWTLRRESRL